MTMRFTDREKFRDKWYRNLTPVQKCIWEYFISECDHAGVLEFDTKMMSLQIGAEITVEDIKFFEKCGKIRFLNDDIIFIPRFILFQQRLEGFNQLNPKNRCHKSILDRLNKFGISPMGSPIEGASGSSIRGYSNSNCKGNSNSNSNDIYCNKDFDKCFEIYQNVCKNLIPLRYERRSKAILELLQDFLNEIEYNFEYVNEVCILANKLEKIMDTKIDFKMLLRNHAGIMSGKYGKTKTVTDYKY